MNEDDTRNHGDHPLTYGEMIPSSLDRLFYAMVDKSQLTAVCNRTSKEPIACALNTSSDSNRAFMDLGSGTGKIVIQAFLSGLFTKSYGVEITKTRFQMLHY